MQTWPLALSNEVLLKHSKNGLHILGVVKLGIVAKEGLAISELSGLAWDDDEEILYAVSDKGYLLHLKPVLSENRLIDLQVKDAFILKDDSDLPLADDDIDSEGIELLRHRNDIRGDTELLIAFERKPRIARYRPDGSLAQTLSIPGFLGSIRNYRNMNTTLESVAHDAKHGISTAPEKLSENYSDNEFQIFNLAGEKWSFKNSGDAHGAITGMTATVDGSILVLERIFYNVFTGLRFSLHHIRLAEKQMYHRIVMDIGPEHGFFNDNFEGITHYRDKRFFMISDDNKHPLQRTLLVFFSIDGLDTPARIAQP